MVAVSWLTEPDSDWDSPEEPHRYDDEPKSRVKLIALVLGGWLAVSLIVLVLLVALTGKHSTNHASGPSTPAVTSAPPSGASPAASGGPALPAGWTRQASDSQTDCAAHSYGQVRSFFAGTPCTSVKRLLATTSVQGRTVVIASNVVAFDTPVQAQKYLALVNADGTGNISDLLREGVTFAGAPAKLPDAAFASRQAGSTVLVAEAAYITGSSDAGDPTLRAVASRGIG